MDIKKKELDLRTIYSRILGIWDSRKLHKSPIIEMSINRLSKKLVYKRILADVTIDIMLNTLDTKERMGGEEFLTNWVKVPKLE